MEMTTDVLWAFLSTNRGASLEAEKEIVNRHECILLIDLNAVSMFAPPKKPSDIKASIDLILTICVSPSYLQEFWMFCFEL